MKILAFQVFIAPPAFLLKDVTFHNRIEFARRLNLSFKILKRLSSGVECDSSPHALWGMDARNHELTSLFLSDSTLCELWTIVNAAPLPKFAIQRHHMGDRSSTAHYIQPGRFQRSKARKTCTRSFSTRVAAPLEDEEQVSGPLGPIFTSEGFSEWRILRDDSNTPLNPAISYVACLGVSGTCIVTVLWHPTGHRGHRSVVGCSSRRPPSQ